MEKARESPRSEHVDTVTSLFGGRSVVITVRPRTRAIHCPYICVCRFLLINFKTLRIFFRAGARGPERGAEGVKIGDGRRVGCHRRGLLNRLVRGRTEPPICTCTRVINGLRTDFKSWKNSLLQEKLSTAYRALPVVFYKLNCIKTVFSLEHFSRWRSLFYGVFLARGSRRASCRESVWSATSAELLARESGSPRVDRNRSHNNTQECSNTHTHDVFFLRPFGSGGRGFVGRGNVKNTRKKAKL